MQVQSKKKEVLEEIGELVHAIKTVYANINEEPPALVSMLLDDIADKAKVPETRPPLAVVLPIKPA